MMKTHMFAILLVSMLARENSSAQDNSVLIHKIEGKEVAYPRLSADGTKILYQSNQDGPWQLWIMDKRANTHTQITKDKFNNNFPDWSYDNQWIAFTSDRDGNEEIYLMRIDGSDMKRITNDLGRDIHPYFSPDGQYLLFNSTRVNGSFDIFRYTIASGELKQLSATHENETCARYSPDMKHIVYLQNSPASDDVFVADSLNKTSTNVSGTPGIFDGWPMFSYDNEWIYYSSAEEGSYSIYKVKHDGSRKTKITNAGAGEDDARVSLSRDGAFAIYNKQIGKTIEIRDIKLL